MSRPIKELVQAAMGNTEPDLVLKNCTYLNVFTGDFVKGDIAVHKGYFARVGGSIDAMNTLDCRGKTIVPGFIDSHIHLESSVVSPMEFAKTVAPLGTTTVVCDPHEIANVLGELGIEYMLQATENLPIDVFFMVSSCVPASPFDENGCTVGDDVIEKYLANPRVLGLAEMMNFPGVTMAEQSIVGKLALAHSFGKVIDGHAPGLTGKALAAYACTGISSDHECTTIEEALEKLSLGQWIMIREGTACKNLMTLLPLINEKYHSRCVFACDDKHPADLLSDGHIDYIVRKAIENGAHPALVYKVASYNGAVRFGLRDRGAIAPGYKADFVVLDNVEAVEIAAVYKNGVSTPHQPLDSPVNVDKELSSQVYNTMHLAPLTVAQIGLKREREKVIGLVPGEIITLDCGDADAIDVAADILKVCVVERHHNTGHIGVAFVKGYELKRGAVATSVAHDSHNIIAIGATDEDIVFAVNSVREMHGGMVVVDKGEIKAKLPLPIAGLMCDLPAVYAKTAIDGLREAAAILGVNKDIDPIMTLSFISLPVIPKLKLTTLGVVDVDKFELI